MSVAVVFATSGASMWAWVWMAIFAALCWRGLSRRSRRIIGALVVALLVAASVASAGPVWWFDSCEACQAQLGWLICFLRSWCV